MMLYTYVNIVVYFKNYQASSMNVSFTVSLGFQVWGDEISNIDRVVTGSR